jgi:hypothetical protein
MKDIFDQVAGDAHLMPWYFFGTWAMILFTWQMFRRGPSEAGGLSLLISALNSINTPLIAITVIAQGMIFDIVCQKYGVSNDAATGVIGAGIGMLTGQGINALQQIHAMQEAQKLANPNQPAGPAQPKE